MVVRETLAGRDGWHACGLSLNDDSSLAGLHSPPAEPVTYTVERLALAMVVNGTFRPSTENTWRGCSTVMGDLKADESPGVTLGKKSIRFAGDVDVN